jgi:uncharacterized protein YjiS (DUF1127 family)
MTTNPALSRRRPFAIANQLPSLGMRIVERIREWRRRSRSRRDLMTLGERELWDIRLSRAEAEHEASKPFWKE